jgi:hypothetical protein
MIPRGLNRAFSEYAVVDWVEVGLDSPFDDWLASATAGVVNLAVFFSGCLLLRLGISFPLGLQKR